MRLHVAGPRVPSLGLMVGLFGLAHVAYYLRGVRFDVTPLAWYWQYLDPLSSLETLSWRRDRRRGSVTAQAAGVE
jgi:hypothetical protein